MGWMVKEYSLLYKVEPSIEKIVDTTIDYAEPALVILLDAAGGAAAVPEVTAIISEAQSDLKVVSALIYDFGATPTAAGIVKGVQDNLQNLETAGHIKDSVTSAKLQLIVKTVGVLAAAIARVVEANQTPKPAAV